MKIPAITTQQMSEVDRMMIEEYGIGLVQMMENAGRDLAELSRRMLGGDVNGKRIAVLCGAGNNGGGGMASARHLHNWGAQIAVKVLAHQNKLKNVSLLQYHILEEMGIIADETIELDNVDLVIDAMIGYGLSGNPHGIIADWIRRVNAARSPILALDVPSGLNATTGIPGEPCIHATATMTLALPKIGLISPEAKEYVGKLYLADISVPPQLYTRLDIEIPPIFIHDSVVKIEARWSA